MDTPKKTAVVTGASRGLGLGIARRLSAAGFHVVLAARGEAQLRAAAEAVGGTPVPTDVTSTDDVRRLVAAALERTGTIDVLVNNAAAVPVVDDLGDLTAEAFLRGFAVDVAGTLLVSQAVAPHLRGGTVVNVLAARGGDVVGPAHLSVAPSQAALFALTRNLVPRLDATVHGLMPAVCQDGETGRVAAAALNLTLGPGAPRADDIGDAVVELLDHDDPGMWSVGDGGTLSRISAESGTLVA